MRRTLSLALSTLVCLLAPLASAQERLEFPDAGFAITIADPEWKHQAVQSEGRTGVVGIGPPALGGLAQITIQIALTADEGVAASQQMLDTLRAQVQAAPGIEFGEDLELELAGHRAPGFAIVQQAQGQTFRVRLHYLTVKGFQYRIQFHAPQDQYDELWPLAEQTLDSLELLAADESTQATQKLKALAARCGSQVNWIEEWEDAATLARTERKLIVVAVAATQGFSLGNPLMEGLFSDPEVVTLMGNRFIAYEWQPGDDAPFTRHDVFGMSPTTLGTGLLICQPSGEVVREVFLPEADLAAHVLRASLHGHPGLAQPVTPVGLSGAARVQWAIDQGMLQQAASWLGPVPAADQVESPELSLQRARLALIHQDLDAAEQALNRISKEAAAEVQQRATLRRASLATARGQYALARDLAQELQDEPLSEELMAYAILQEAMGLWALGQREELRGRLETLCASYPDQPAAWVAAAALTGYALEIDVTPNLTAFTEEDFRLTMMPPAAGDGVEMQPAQALADAVDWLLTTQREDGSWPTPMSIRDAQIAPDPVTMATQALAIQALAEFALALSAEGDPRPAHAYEAVMRGIPAYLERRQLVREHPREVAFMDYTCWGSSYGAAMLARLLEIDVVMDLGLFNEDLREQLRAEMQHCVDDLQRIVQANGGWSYYLSGEVGGDALVAAMSFTTATVLNALQDARRQGAEVDEAVLENGYACLLSLRGTNQAFDYLTTGPKLPNLGEVEVIGGAARGPHCADALLRQGILKETDLRLPFLRYVEHLGSFGDQSRRALMHCGPNTQGSHYLMYDYLTGAEALARSSSEAVPQELREQMRQAILDQMARCRSEDGSFIDNPLIGAVAGTSQGVLALLHLRYMN